MFNIFKHLLWIAPVTAVILFLVLHGQNEHKATMQVESTKFDRDEAEDKAAYYQEKAAKARARGAINEAKEFEKMAAKYEGRATGYEQDLTKAKTEQEVAAGKNKQIGQDFDQAMKQVDQELEKKGGK